MTHSPFAAYEIRDYRHDDAAALFVVQAAIAPVDAGDMLAWTDEIEERVEGGGRIWVAARGSALAGYAVIDPVPGLPGVYDLAGGVTPARRRRGLGTALLQRVQNDVSTREVRQLSCRVDTLTSEPAIFLLRRGFFVEHEECLLELADLNNLPPIPDSKGEKVATLPRARAVAEFCRLYQESFRGLPWSQPYSEAEVMASLARPEDLLFITDGSGAFGVIWHEVLPDGRGRVEPLGIAHERQGRGYGRRLLTAALHDLRRRGARLVEIGAWRDNHPALALYGSMGFVEAGNWFFLAWEPASQPPA